MEISFIRATKIVLFLLISLSIRLLFNIPIIKRMNTIDNEIIVILYFFVIFFEIVNQGFSFFSLISAPIDSPTTFSPVSMAVPPNTSNMGFRVLSKSFNGFNK